MNDENQIIIEAWNTILFEKFCRFRHLLTEGLGGHSDEAFRRHPPQPGQRVLDVGCGFGETTHWLAEQVGNNGQAVGVDCAQNFIDEATKGAREAGCDNASFLVADVQTQDLHGPYDRAYSRFGTMFFNLPGAALRNIKRALAPGAKFTMIVWRKREDNPWLYDAEQAVRAIVPVVDHEDTDQVHCGPGPFSMSGPDMVSAMLAGAGYDQITFERYDCDICIGKDLDEAVEFAMALGPAGEIIRLAAEEGERLKGEVNQALRKTLAVYERDGEIWAPSSTWFISARNPG